jgi:hypothetical protein
MYVFRDIRCTKYDAWRTSIGQDIRCIKYDAWRTTHGVRRMAYVDRAGHPLYKVRRMAYVDRALKGSTVIKMSDIYMLIHLIISCKYI